MKEESDMTSQEAQKKVDQCENAIVAAYRSLHSQAQNTVFNVDKAASGYTSAATLLPLLISVLGLILLFTRHWYGIVFLALGIFIAVKAHGSAKITENRAKSESKSCQNTLNSNRDI